MLVLTRTKGEAIMIGDDIEVFICNIGGGRVSVGINAPNSVPIYRKEIWNRINAEKSQPNRSKK